MHVCMHEYTRTNTHAHYTCTHSRIHTHMHPHIPTQSEDSSGLTHTHTYSQLTVSPVTAFFQFDPLTRRIEERVRHTLQPFIALKIDSHANSSVHLKLRNSPRDSEFVSCMQHLAQSAITLPGSRVLIARPLVSSFHCPQAGTRPRSRKKQVEEAKPPDYLPRRQKSAGYFGDHLSLSLSLSLSDTHTHTHTHIHTLLA